MKKIKTFQDELNLGTYSQFVNDFHKESDRAAGTLAAAYLDQALRKCLLSYLRDDQIVLDLFDKSFGPLSSFSARSKVAFALGLIDKDTLRDIDIIRDIRNHFAHHPLGTSFSNPDVKHLCNELTMAKILKSPEHERVPRDIYLLAVGMIVLRYLGRKRAAGNGDISFSRPLRAMP